MSENGHNPLDNLDAQESEMWLARPDEELGAFADEVRDAFVRPAPPEMAERHVAAMLAEAHRVTDLTVPDAPPAELTTVRVPIVRRWTLARRVAVVALGTLALGAGMAVAGVRPPEPVSDVLESVGVDVPGSDADSDAKTDDQAGGANRKGSEATDTGSRADAGENAANDGATPGAKHANEHAAEGQETAEQARSGQAPPDTPGQSGEHSHSQGQGTPPESPGNSENAPHGKPDSPPGQSSAHDGPEQSNAPDEPPRHGHDT